MNKDDIDKFIDDHRELFENIKFLDNLEKQGLSNKEIEVFSFLKLNGDVIKQITNKSHNSAWHLFPTNLQDIYIDNYTNHLLLVIKKEIEHSFQLTPEEINNIINKDLLILIMGNEFICPPK